MSALKSITNGVAAFLFAVSLAVPALLPSKVFAAVPTNLTRSPKISFTFDDGLTSARTLAAPTLQKYGYTGTNYVISSCVGMTTIPNTCLADQDVSYMSWSQIKELQTTYGWEIGSHTATHPYLASDGGGEQAGLLTTAQITKELADSKNAIATNTGVTPTAFASPYGDYNPSGNPVLSEVAKLYTSHRGFADTGYNITPWNTTDVLAADNVPLNNYLIRNQQVQSGTSVATVKTYIDKAIADNAWLVLTFHEIKANNASTSADDYQYNNADLDAIAAYAKSKGIANTNISAGLPTMSANNNLFANSSFDSAIGTYVSTTPSTTGWTADATTIKQDTGNHGSIPSSTNSVAFTASTVASHLFSQRVAVDPTKTYISNTFVNMTSANTTDEIAFFIDEYAADGSYLTTQYKKSIFNGVNPLVKNWNFTYTPTAGAATASLQIYISAGATGYIDNAQLFAADGTGAVVTPPVISTSDLNGDGKVDALDLSTLLTNWNKTGQTAAQGNINGDAVIDALDLSTLLTNWSK